MKDIKVSDLYFRAMFHLLLLWNGVGDDYSLETSIIDARYGGPREDAVGKDGINLGGTCWYQPRKISKREGTGSGLYIIIIIIKLSW